MNPHNFCPVFTHEQIAASLRATILTTPTLCAATILDQNQLYSDILATLPLNTSISNHLLHPEGCWSKDGAGFLRLDNRMYILDNANLRLRVLQYHHDHVLAGHLGQNKTLELIRVTNFIWPYLHQFSIDSHGLNGYGKPLKRPFDRYQSRLEAINNGQDIRQIN